MTVIVSIYNSKHSSDQCKTILFLILFTDSLITSSDACGCRFSSEVSRRCMLTVLVSMHTPEHNSDPLRADFDVFLFSSVSRRQCRKMLCVWCQFRGLYRCMVIVLVDIRTPKHSSDQCGSI